VGFRHGLAAAGVTGVCCLGQRRKVAGDTLCSCLCGLANQQSCGCGHPGSALNTTTGIPSTTHPSLLFDFLFTACHPIRACLQYRSSDIAAASRLLRSSSRFVDNILAPKTALRAPAIVFRALLRRQTSSPDIRTAMPSITASTV